MVPITRRTIMIAAVTPRSELHRSVVRTLSTHATQAAFTIAFLIMCGQ